MSLDHVADLVSESSGQLVELIRALNESPVHVYVPARQRERIDLPGIHDVKVPIQIGAARGLRNRFAKILDVPTDGGIGYNRQLRVYFFGVLPPHRDFLVLGNGAGRKCENQCSRGR
jgi:hypothetical protein